MQPLIDAQRAELRADFAYNDNNEDGFIEFDEFCSLLEDLEAGMSVQDVEIGFRTVDVDKNGKIDFNEFADWWEGR